MIVNRGWQESTTTEEEMQAVNRNINEQKKQTIETLRQTIKEWDISGRIGETVSRIKIDTYNWTGFHTLRGILNQNIREIRIEINEDTKETMQEKIKRMPVTEASRMAVY